MSADWERLRRQREQERMAMGMGMGDYRDRPAPRDDMELLERRMRQVPTHDLPSFSLLAHRHHDHQNQSVPSLDATHLNPFTQSPEIVRLRSNGNGNGHGNGMSTSNPEPFAGDVTSRFSFSDPSPGARWREREFSFPALDRRRYDSPELRPSHGDAPSSGGSMYMTDDDFGNVRMDDSEAAAKQDASAPTSSGDPSAHLREAKRSRYLREMDRRIILARIDRGEKQSALAKEYQVSRSTICNLYKQRHIVLSRTDENPLSRHPKKTRHGSVKHPSTAGIAGDSASDASTDKDKENKQQQQQHLQQAPLFQPGVVVEVKSRAVALLLAVVENETVRVSHLQRSTDRLMRLLLEEACAIAASSSMAPTPEDSAFDHTIQLCAISMEQQGHTMLTAFHEIEPYRPSGYIHFEAMGKAGDAMRVRLVDANHLPTTLQGLHVLLVDTAAHSGSAICATIKKLLEHGAMEALICVVALFVSAEAIALVHYAHPQVVIITTKVETRWHSRDDAPSPPSAISMSGGSGAPGVGGSGL